jgi:hypothetical protein
MHHVSDQSVIQAVVEQSSGFPFRMSDDGVCLMSDDQGFVASIVPSDSPSVHKIYIAVLPDATEHIYDYFHDVVSWLYDFTEIRNLIACVELDKTSGYYAFKEAGFRDVGVIYSYGENGDDAAIFQFQMRG